MDNPTLYRVIDKQTLEVTVKVVPKASAQRIVGLCPLEGEKVVLKVTLTVVPEGGKANAALVALLAKTWHIAKSKISLVSGGTSRLKVLRIFHLSQEEQGRILQDINRMINTL